MVHRPSEQEQSRSNGVSDVASPYLGPAPDHSMLFDVKDIVDVSVANASTADVLAKGSKGMFNTASVQLYIYIYISILLWLGF